jgi:DNA-directed RNA polymerase specialized sigma24 family protein
MAELLEGWHRQEVLAAGFARLGERCRTLLTLIFLDQEEPSYDDVSAQLGIPKGSIGPTRNRCLQQLRSLLEGLGFAE